MAVITHTRKFKVGKSYAYNDILDYQGDNDFNEDSFGESYIGKEAIRLTDEDEDTDIWFILSSATATTYYYRCVYNSQFEI